MAVLLGGTLVAPGAAAADLTGPGGTPRVSQRVINAGGGDSQGGSFRLSGSVGETVVQTLSGPGLRSLNGFLIFQTLASVQSAVTVSGVPELLYSAPVVPTATLVSSASTTGTVVLASARGIHLSLISNLYELGPENTTFSPPAMITLAYDPAALGSVNVNSLAIYDYDTATGNWIKLGGTLDANAHTLTVTVTRLASILGVFGDTPITFPGLVSYWPFDDGTARDLAGTNNGTVVGAAPAAGKVSGALSFNGSGQYVDVSNAASLDLRSAMSVEAWVKFNSLGGGTYGYQIVAAKVTDATYQYSFGVRGSNGLRFNFGNSDSEVSISPGFSTGIWYHLAGVSSVNGQHKYYVNGQEVWSTGPPTSVASVTAALRIGNADGSGFGSNWFNGTIDEVGLYDRVLTPQEIQQHYQQGINSLGYFAPDTVPPTVSATSPAAGDTGVLLNAPISIAFSEAMDPATLSGAFAITPSVAGALSYANNVLTFTPSAPLQVSTAYAVTAGVGAKDPAGNALAAPVTFSFTTGDTAVPAGLVSFWPFDDGSAKDLAGTNGGTVVGAVAATGKVGGALGFNGTAQYVDAGGAASLDLKTAMSVEAWVKFNSLGGGTYGYETVAAKVTDNSYQYSFGIRGSNGLRFNFGNSDSEVSVSPGFSTGIWYYLVGVSSLNGVHRYYVNGTQVWSGTPATSVTSVTAPLRIGNANAVGFGTNWFNGTIDEVGLYSRVLSPQEIQQRYQIGLQGVRYFTPPPSAVSWIGPSGGSWHAAVNWSPALVPDATLDVTIDATAVVNSTAPVAFKSLVLGDAAGTFGPRLVLAAPVASGGAVTVHKNAVLEQSTMTALAFSDLTLLANSKLTHTANPSGTGLTYAVNLALAGTLDLRTGAHIDVDGLGYPSGSGPAAGSQFTGSGHGGQGGWTGWPPPAPAYDSATDPVDAGSGGGTGSPGGGVVLIQAGTAAVNGVVSANGLTGSYPSGGGAGGTIRIAAAVLSGAGTVQANGGGTGGNNTGGGGGGRVALRATSLYNASFGAKSALGGYNNSNAIYNGAPGTVYEALPGAHAALTISGPANPGTRSNTSVPGASLAVDTLTVSEARVVFDAGSAVTVAQALNLTGAYALTAGVLNIPAGASLTVPAGAALTLDSLSAAGLTAAGTVAVDTMSLTGDLVLQAGAVMTRRTASAAAWTPGIGSNVTIAANATLSVAGMGFAGGKGPGAGPDAVKGGGHGGVGGAGYSGSSFLGSGGPANDDFRDPRLPGSGGGNFPNSPGGTGGGAVVLSVPGTLTVNGLVDATGGGADGCAGGGAGGSINLSAATLAGNGTLRANGGATGTNCSTGMGSGAGGLIAVRASGTDTSQFAYEARGGATSVTWAGNRGGMGGAGILYHGFANGEYDLSIDGGPALFRISDTPLSSPVSVRNLTLNNAVVRSSTTPQALSVASAANLNGIWSLNAGALTLPVTVTALTVPAGCALTAASLSPSLSLTVNGALDVAAPLAATGLTLSGRLTNSSLTVTGDLIASQGGLITGRTENLPRSLEIGVSGNMLLAAGSTVTATGTGYPGVFGANGSGPQGGGSGSIVACGGGHGGAGGRGYYFGFACSAGGVYDSASDPSQPGSAGGGNANFGTGGNGGGLLRITVGGTLTLDGRVEANGADGSNPSRSPGGGAGGSVVIAAPSVSGSGAVHAGGGRGAAWDGTAGAGGGGGGRIVLATLASSAGIVLHVEGGAAGGSAAEAGGPGSSRVAGRFESSVLVGGVPELGLTAPASVSGTLVSGASTTGTVVLASAKGKGITLISSLYELGPENTTFNPPATITMHYDPAALGNISPNTLAIYDYDTQTGTWIKLDGALDLANHSITVSVTQFASVFGIFGGPFECGTVLTADATMVADMSCPGTALVMGADRLTLDCAGHTISYGSSLSRSYGVQASGASNGAIRNCRIVQGGGNSFSDAVALGSGFSVTYSTISTTDGTSDGVSAGGGGNTISRNVINSGRGAVYVAPSVAGNRILGNRLTGVGPSGVIFIERGTDTEIDGNAILGPSVGTRGVWCAGQRTRITSNTFTTDGEGVVLAEPACASSSVLDNAIDQTGTAFLAKNGIIVNFFDNTIARNVIRSQHPSGSGITLGLRGLAQSYGMTEADSATRNLIKDNRITAATGIYLSANNSGNTLYNNRIAAAAPVGQAGYTGTNTWNIAKQAGTNIEGGGFLGGNYWADPSGNGFSETCMDADQDRLCDAAFALTDRDSDALPLAAPDTTPPIVRVSSPAANAAGWHRADVTITFSGQDARSGIASCSGPVTLSTEGPGQSASGTCTDNAGNPAGLTVSGINIDKSSPTLSIASPTAGSYVANRDAILVSFSATDALDPAPTATARLVRLTAASGASGRLDGPVTVSNGQSFNPLDLSAGRWRLELQARDQADNLESAASQTFTVIHDIQPPRVTPTVGAPSAGADPVFVTRNTVLSFSAVDDLVAVGDGQGLGLSSLIVGVDGATRAAVSGSPVSLTLPDAEGAHRVTFQAVDVLGNAGALGVLAVSIDNTGPAVSAVLSPVPNAAGWNNSDVNVSWSGTDAGAGLAACDAQATVTAEGAGQARPGTCTDVLGNASQGSVTVSVDKTSPTISAARAPAANAAGWNNGDVTVTFTCADALSGTASCTGPATLREGAGQSASGTATDLAGNSASTSLGGVSVDKTTPTITAVRAPAANAAGWNNTDVTVSFTCSDALSGVGSCTGPATLGEGANQSASGSATDLAGNSAAASLGGVNVDKTAPTISAARAPAANAAGWNNSDVTVTFTCADALSGTASCTGPATLGQGADQSASGTATDVAGNSASTSLGGIQVDKTPPVITATRAPLANANGWNNTDVTVSFTCSDALSGTTGCPAPVTLGDGANQSASGSVSDRAGNSASATLNGINVNKVPPTITASRSPAANGFGWNNTAVTVSFTCSGVLGPGACPAPVILNEGAEQSVSGSVTDLADNTSSTTLSGVSVDTTAPTISLTRLPAANGDGWNNTNVTVSFTCGDALAGIAGCAAPIVLSAEGANQSASGTAADKAGNSATASIGGISIDKTVSSTTLSTQGGSSFTRFGQVYMTTDTRYVLSSTDALAGVRLTLYRIDAGSQLVYSSPFLLTEGTHTITFSSQDRADNNEPAQSRLYNVSVFQGQGGGAGGKKSIEVSGTIIFRGDLITNGAFTGSGKTQIIGNVTAPSITLKGQSQITGLQTISPDPINPAPFDLGAVLAAVSASNRNAEIAGALKDSVLKLSKGALTLKAGNYLLEGLELSGGAVLNVEGETGILVRGRIKIDGGARVNDDGGDAERLALFSDSDKPVHLSGGARLGALLYAPNSEVKLSGNAQFGGHLFASHLDMSGHAIAIQSGHSVPPDPSKKFSSVSLLTPQADATFRLGEVYAFPNPARGSQKPTLHVESGLADAVRIHIYDLAGDLVHSDEAAGPPGIVDDGQGPQYAFEVLWDTDRVGSGVYVYVIEARKSGEAPLKKIGKVAVIK